MNLPLWNVTSVKQLLTKSIRLRSMRILTSTMAWTELIMSLDTLRVMLSLAAVIVTVSSLIYHLLL